MKYNCGIQLWNIGIQEFSRGIVITPNRSDVAETVIFYFSIKIWYWLASKWFQSYYFKLYKQSKILNISGHKSSFTRPEWAKLLKIYYPYQHLPSQKILTIKLFSWALMKHSAMNFHSALTLSCRLGVYDPFVNVYMKRANKNVRGNFPKCIHYLR